MLDKRKMNRNGTPQVVTIVKFEGKAYELVYKGDTKRGYRALLVRDHGRVKVWLDGDVVDKLLENGDEPVASSEETTTLFSDRDVELIMLALFEKAKALRKVVQNGASRPAKNKASNELVEIGALHKRIAELAKASVS